jgi:hypothetical protein
MKIALTIMFMVALSLSVYFFGKLMTWVAYKINPSNFKREFTNKDILHSNISMIVAIILWSIIFYCKL